MDTQLNALPTLPVLARTVSGCVNSAFLGLERNRSAVGKTKAPLALRRPSSARECHTLSDCPVAAGLRRPGRDRTGARPECAVDGKDRGCRQASERDRSANLERAWFIAVNQAERKAGRVRYWRYGQAEKSPDLAISDPSRPLPHPLSRFPTHAINRGNNRADVLGPEGERDMFLGDLARTKARYPFALFGYCLMSNHFHLLLKPAPGQSISRILQSLTVAHTWRHHRRQGTSGHVWQGRFRSPVIQDGDHLLVVLRYIEANPVRAAMVADPCEYTWSSHRCHGAGHADPILDSFPEWEQLGRTEPERRARWRRKVRGEQPAKELDGVRSSVRSGRPYGAEDWVEVISHRLGIVREPRRRGRPPREKML